MNRYSMPVHPKALSEDFESEKGALRDIEDVLQLLRYSRSSSDLDSRKATYVNNILSSLWYRINHRQGINLRDREKLVPVFKEMNRLFPMRTEYTSAYRGVRVSKWDPTILRDTYPDSINNPKVVEHLESLAYGLRSWSSVLNLAEAWASGEYSNKEFSDKDMVIFEILNPDVILDANPVLRFFNRYGVNMFDEDELLIYVKNPKIVSIEKYKVLKYPSCYLVKIKDN